MKGTARRKNRQPSLQDDSGSNNGGKTTPVPAAAGPPEEWRLEAAIVSLLTLTDGDNRLICPPFRVLPTPTEFPLYYEHIKNPIDLKCIAERVRSGQYADWASMEADIQLLCQNAKDFSESGPMLRKDADLLLDHFKSRASELAGARRFSARVLARNKENIDELLRSTASEVDEYSEDSEEDEDSESSNDPAWRLYWTIRNFDVVDGVPLCENFMELPSKRSYPDYYEEIERPMSLYMINKKLKRGQYIGGTGPAQKQQQPQNHQLHGLVQDLLLMFDNACSYNIEESDIYEAAQRLRKLTLQTVKKLDSAYKTNTSQKAIKQEVLDDNDEEAEDAEEMQQQKHSPPPTILPKMNGTSAVPPPPKRRKVGPKSDDRAPSANSNHSATTVAPVRRMVKREASAKGEQAIKRMVDSDLEEDAIIDHFQQRPTTAGSVPNHQTKNTLKNGAISGLTVSAAEVVPPPSASLMSLCSATTTTTVTPDEAASSSTAANKSHHKPRTPRRMNADGTPAERLKPGRKSVDELREKFAQKLTAVWQDVHNLKMGDRSLAEPFLYLPCDKTFPDYYRTIAKPISLMCIQRKIKEQRYADSDELLADLRLMFANARSYNKPDAQICADSTILESVAVGSMRTHTDGVTLFYPYRRTDKGWSEKASIERSPLKMKRKGVAGSTATPANVDGTNASPPSSSTATTTATSTTATTTAATTTASSGLSNTSAPNGSPTGAPPPQPQQQQQLSLAPSAAAAVYVAPPLPPSASSCPTMNNAMPSTSGAVYYAASCGGGVVGGYLGPQQTQQQQIVLNTATPASQQLTHPIATNSFVHHVQQQYHQQLMASASSSTLASVKQQQQHYLPQQQYFASPQAVALHNGGIPPPNALMASQIQHNGPIAAATAPSSSSCSASSSTVGPTVLYVQHQQQQQQQQPYFQYHHHQDANGSAAAAAPPYSAAAVTALPQQQPPPSSSIPPHQLSGTNASLQQVIIDPGRAVVNAMPKMALPVFVEPSASVKIQRVLHSEAYVRYIESMYSNKVQRTVSKWDKNLQATQRNTPTAPSAAPSSATSTSTAPSSIFFDAINTSNNINGNNRKQLAQHWIRLSSNGSKRREEVLMRALWTLRDQLIEGTLGVARHAELPPGEPPTASPSTTSSATAAAASVLAPPSSSSGGNSSKSDRNNNNNHSSARMGGGVAGAGPSTSAAVVEKR